MNGLKTTRKKDEAAQLKELSQHLTGGSEEKHEKHQSE
jgi:hypothetical protein